MKKFYVIFALFALISLTVTAQPQLTWRFANVGLINAATQLQFDVEVLANAGGTYQRDLQIYFDYNTLGFGSNIVANGKITYTPLTLMDISKYVVVNMADNTSSKFAIITEAIDEMTQPGSAADYTEITTSYQGLLRFTIDIASLGQSAGIVFDQVLMNGGQYYQSTSNTNPIKYADPSVYNNDLSTFILSSASGALTYNNVSNTPLVGFTVKLSQGGLEKASGITNATGNFNIFNVMDGVYDITHTWTIARGGCNILDAINTRQFLGGSYPMTALQQKAANVNNNVGVDILDAIFMQQSLSGPQPAGWTAPDFVFLPQTITIVGGIGTASYQGLCSGDPNRSHTP
jgi:hypothetical protein